MSAVRPVGGGSPWRLSPHGVRVVAGVEVRRLLRSRAWLISLAVWCVVVTGLTVLLLGSVGSTGGSLSDSGIFLFALVAFGVLSLGALVAPALTATSINGERRDGTLATWQATLLTPAEIALGKLTAGWAAAIALVLGATPSLLLSYFAAPAMGVGRVFSTLGIVMLTLLVVVTIGLAMSAVVVSPVTSTVVTYLLVVALGLGGPMMFGLTVALVTTEVEVTEQRATRFDPVTSRPVECRPVTSTQNLPRTDLTWPLLAGSPFVILADAAPRLASSSSDLTTFDVLGGLSAAVRQARLGPGAGYDDCDEAAASVDQAARDALPPVWGWGVLFLLALGVGSWLLTVRRLVVPIKRLSRGQRIA